MAEQLGRIEYLGSKLTGPGTARVGIFACRYLSGSYADPAAPYATGSNEWFELVEDNPVGSPVSYFYGDIPKGRYRLMVEDGRGGMTLHSVIGHKENVHHSTPDLENHIEDIDTDMRHQTTAIAIPATEALRLGSTAQDAIDNIAGTDWDRTFDNSLKGHLDDAIDAHPASAISCTVGGLGDVESALDDHEIRLTALETGTATTPTGIHDFLGDLGIDVIWTPQDVAGIEYKSRHLWKHTGESVPATYADLTHEGRQLNPMSEIPYYSRRFDLTSSPDTNLVLYYAVGAKGRADADFVWSAVQSIEVELPSYTHEFTGVLNGFSVCSSSSGGSASVYALDSIEIGSDENWPVAVVEAGVPTDGYLRIPFQVHSVTVTAVEIFSQTAMSGDTEVSLRSTTTGTGSSILVTGDVSQGSVSGLSLPVAAGDELQLWTLDPAGIAHYRVKVWFTRT